MTDTKKLKVSTDKSIYELQAEVCKTIASPKRLEILNLLKEGEKSVGELVELTGSPKANVSQHLAVMRHKGILSSRREGLNVFYSIGNKKVIQACRLMREVLAEQMMEQGKILKTMEE